MDAGSKRSLIIYITGRPGVGKYSIAKELARRGYIICDNQLINNPIFELLNYDGYTKIPDFVWERIARIRDIIFDFLTVYTKHNYVLTNNLYDDIGDKKLYEQVKNMADKRGSVFVPVRLSISTDEHLRRVINPMRRKRLKSINPDEVHDQTKLLKIKHDNLLEIDVSNHSPRRAANEILKHITYLTQK